MMNYGICLASNVVLEIVCIKGTALLPFFRPGTVLHTYFLSHAHALKCGYWDRPFVIENNQNPLNYFALNQMSQTFKHQGNYPKFNW